MRSAFAALAAAVILMPCPAIHAAEEASDLPQRKAGLWEVRTRTDEGRGTQEQALMMCIDEAMERESVRNSGVENRSNCAKYDVRKTADGTIVDAFCVYDTRQVSNHTELRGDFKTTFAVKVVSTTAGAAPLSQGGMPVNISRTIVQQGRYLGESCGELQAGQAKTANGQTVNVQ